MGPDLPSPVHLSLTPSPTPCGRHKWMTPNIFCPVYFVIIYFVQNSNINNNDGLVLASINNTNKSCYICGDFNLNLLNVDTHPKTTEFLNIMSTHSYRPLVEVPTRITIKSSTLIDNIFTNSFGFRDCTGVLIADISDHLPLFVILDWQSHPAKKVNFASYRPIMT